MGIDNSAPLATDHGYPVVSGYRIRTDLPSMEPFTSYRLPGGNPWLQMIGCLPFFIIVAVVSWTIDLIKLRGVGFQFLGIVASGFVALPLSMYVMRVLSLRLGVLNAKRDSLSMSAQSNEYCVGIAYSDKFCFFRGDSNWDRGLLRIGDSGIGFRGFGPGFSLPYSSIETCEIQVCNVGTNRLPRLFVKWTHPITGTNAFSIELIGTATRAKCFTKTTELLALFKRSAEQATSWVDETIYPFQSVRIDINALEPMDVFGSK